MKIPIQAFTALLVVLHGCGGDSGGSSEGAQGKKLSDLSLDERMQLCASSADETEAIASGTCTLGGLDAPAKADCERVRDECNAGMSPITGASCQEQDYSDCTTIRVGQVESCLREASAFFSGLSCDAVGQEPMGPSCIGTLEQGCPTLFDGTAQ